MKDFVKLFTAIDQTTKTNEKVNALAEYFRTASDDDKLWTLGIFSGRNPKRVIKTSQLREWAAEAAGIPLWLFEETYHIVGDLSETISSVLPDYQQADDRSLSEWIDAFQALDGQSDDEKKAFITGAWSRFSKSERFVFNKLTSGSFRIGVSQKLVIKALSKYSGLDENHVSHRLMGSWSPLSTTFHDLLYGEKDTDELSKPYPFYLAYALEGKVEDLGEPQEWQAEHKWDGIRAQLIFRQGELYIWSRGEDLITDKFPEFHALRDHLPNNVVIDGELLPYRDGRVLNFNDLQTRIGRKNLTPKILQDVPAVLFAYDLLEHDGEDQRSLPLSERRAKLEQLIAQVNHPSLLLSPVVSFDTWEQLAEVRQGSRDRQSEGIMLKRKSSAYQVGRKKGDWWKWKIDPLSVDAVMIYAMSGSGRRANLFTDYTFAVWDDEGKLVPFAKAYSGLTDKEIEQVDAWVKKNTIERFGPVRSVKAQLVFEIGFEGINRSTRHKSGIALRFPRMLRWRHDKKPEQADHIDALRKLLEQA